MHCAGHAVEQQRHATQRGLLSSRIVRRWTPRKRSGYGRYFPSQELRPAEVLHRNFWFCTIDDPSTISTRHTVGVDHIMFETDYPHGDGTWPDSQAVFVQPGEESNKGSYWRVYGTTVQYQVDGQTGSFPVTSMISWRGEWYVVHLASIR